MTASAEANGDAEGGAHIDSTHALLAYCRPGFENDCVQELMALAARAQLTGYAKAREGEGLASYVLGDEGDGIAAALAQPLPIFARQLLHAFAHLRDLPPENRLGPIITVLAAAGRRWQEVWVESPDSDAGRELAALTRSFAPVVQRELRGRGLLDAKSPRRLHLLFLDGRSVVLAETDPAHASPWLNGIPRLRRLAGAPSRSAAKLDEGFQVLLDAGERERLIRPGMSAVDLGAAPGGWSWVLAQRHLRVEAIDNGPLAQNVLDSGLVRHVRADGFTWRPQKAVDWLVCDMVEQPSRVAALVGGWLADGACRRALFNLKLPMKKRYAETLRCLDLLREHAGMPLDLRCRQLYHDREEVTVAALPFEKGVR